MDKRIQQLKIAELKQQIAKIRNQQHILNNPVDELQDQIYALEKLIKRGNSAYQGKQKFNFFEKHFTKRNSYKEYQAWLDRQQALSSQMEKIKARIKVQKEVVDMEREGLQRSIDILNREISKIEQTIPQTAINGLEQQGAKSKQDNWDSEAGVLQSAGQKAVQTEKGGKSQDEKKEQQTATAQNPAQSFFLNPKKMVDLIKQIHQMGFYEAINYTKQLKPQIEKLFIAGGVNHEISGDIAQIEAFETEIYKAAGIRPTKIEKTPFNYTATSTARDIVERIMINALVQYPVIVVEDVAGDFKIKPEDRTL